MNILGGFSFTVFAAGTHDFDRIKKTGATFESAKKKLNLKDYDPEKMSQSYLIQMASGQTVDSVSALLTHVSLALIQAEKEYAEAVHALTQLMKGRDFQALEVERKDEQSWDLILECRALVSKASRKQQDLQMLMSSVEKVVEATAEVTYLAGTEEASTMVCERLYSAQNQVQELRQRSLEAEERLREVEAAAIEMASQPQDSPPLDQSDATATEDKPEEYSMPFPEKKDSQSESESPGRRVTVITNSRGLGEMKSEQVRSSGFRRHHQLGEDF